MQSEEMVDWGEDMSKEKYMSARISALRKVLNRQTSGVLKNFSQPLRRGKEFNTSGRRGGLEEEKKRI